ncbi:MAG: Plug domain-containing protein [Prevotellaceae bacterium]|nr:Plug domain-containing protein [Prevotellaceae bacterium]MDY6130738.1 Plug domain-containing protein [Prevotella sp.]
MNYTIVMERKAAKRQTARKTFMLLSFVFMSLTVLADNVRIKGHVENEKGNVMPDMSVMLTDANNRNKVFAYAFTDKSGAFSLDVQTEADSLGIYVTGLNITPVFMKVANKENELFVTVKETSIALPEVRVKSERIYANGDTINYLVSSFLQKNDVSMAEVLKRMPGISVSDMGQISIKGIPIKKLYIEGMDLMKSRYGVATLNIDPNSIASVQVLENHQDVKALKGLQPEERASVNLKLRNNVRGVFNLIATIGGGQEDKTLWNNGLIATYFKHNSQLFATYKGNNTGDDLSRELHSLNYEGFAGTSPVSNIVMPTPPALNKSTYYFNRSHSATCNWVSRTGKHGELGINAAYWTDREQRDSHSSTVHLLPDFTPKEINENFSGKLESQMLYGDISFLENTDKQYLKEQINFEYAEESGRSSVVQKQAIKQQNKMENYRLTNTFHLTKRTSEDKGFELTSLSGLEKRPHSLSVSPNLFPDILNGSGIDQKVERTRYGMKNNARLLSALVWGNFLIHPSLVFNFQHDGLKSDLSGFFNDMELHKIEWGVGWEIYAKLRKLNLRIHTPLLYKYDHLLNIEKEKGIYMEPSAQAVYSMNGSNELRFSTGMTRTMPDIDQLYGQYILTSFRRLSSYAVQSLYRSKMQYGKLSYNFRDIFKMLFTGVDVTYNYQKPDALYGYRYEGESETVISRPTKETAEMVSVRIRGSKGFSWKHLKIDIEGTYTYSSSPLLVQDEVVRYHSNSYLLTTHLNALPFTWLNISYDGAMGWNKTNHFPVALTSTNKCTASIALPQNISLSANLSHYRNNMNMGDKSFLLGNFAVTYTYKRFLFTLRCNNIFNRKDYTYSFLDEMSSYSSTYTIRPRSVVLTLRMKLV